MHARLQYCTIVLPVVVRKEKNAKQKMNDKCCAFWPTVLYCSEKRTQDEEIMYILYIQYC
jgi:hypothetical protein